MFFYFPEYTFVLGWLTYGVVTNSIGMFQLPVAL